MYASQSRRLFSAEAEAFQDRYRLRIRLVIRDHDTFLLHQAGAAQLVILGLTLAPSALAQRRVAAPQRED
jgi:hypothetical protein